MLDDKKESSSDPIGSWLASFEQAIARSDFDSVTSLFHPDAYWRDILAFTWDIQTVFGAVGIVELLAACTGAAPASAFEIDVDRTPPRLVTRAGTEVLEAIFAFRTTYGPGSGVLRLLTDDQGQVQEPPLAWTLLTALDTLEDTAAAAAEGGSAGKAYSRDFRGPNWYDDR